MPNDWKHSRGSRSGLVSRSAESVFVRRGGIAFRLFDGGFNDALDAIHLPSANPAFNDLAAMIDEHEGGEGLDAPAPDDTGVVVEDVPPGQLVLFEELLQVVSIVIAADAEDLEW